MSEEYLWDCSGEPDAELAHLEETLGKLRWSSKQLKVDSRIKPRGLKQWRMLAAAAALVAAIIAAGFIHKRTTAGLATSWQLSLRGGRPRAVRMGQVIETTAATRATMRSEFVGEVEIEPDARLRLLATGDDQERLALDHGTIHALIWAPPAKFVVDTPSAKTVDLGCEYTLHVEKDGAGFLTVEVGWVAFQWHGIESFIPAGAACMTRPAHGPETPYFLDAAPDFKKAIAQFDDSGSNQALKVVLATATPHDGLSLWHLLQRTRGDERAQVFDRFAALVSLPPNVTREAVLRGDGKSMDAAWDALQLGDTTWWREWKRKW